MLVGKPILQEGETLIGDNLDAKSVLHLPLPLQGEESLVDKGGDVRVDVQGKFLYLQFVDQIVYLTFQRVGEEDGWLDASLAETGWASFIGVHVHGRAYTLAGNLHESEFAERQDVVLGTVFLHVLAHAFVEFLPVLGQTHIDEVDYNDAAHITQTQLSGQLIGCSQVYVEGVGLLTVGGS